MGSGKSNSELLGNMEKVSTLLQEVITTLKVNVFYKGSRICRVSYNRININSIEIKATSKIPGARVLKQFQSFLCGVDDHS